MIIVKDIRNYYFISIIIVIAVFCQYVNVLLYEFMCILLPSCNSGYVMLALQLLVKFLPVVLVVSYECNYILSLITPYN